MEHTSIREHCRARLDIGGGMIPCSRYGRHSDDLLDILDTLAHICHDSTGETTDDSINGLISALVNDSDDPESLILAHASMQQVENLLDYFNHNYISADDRAAFRDGWLSAAIFADSYTDDSMAESSDAQPTDWNVGGIVSFSADDFTDDSDDVDSEVENVLDCIGALVAALVGREMVTWRIAGEHAYFSSHRHGTGWWDCGYGPVGDRLHELTPNSESYVVVDADADSATIKYVEV